MFAVIVRHTFIWLYNCDKYVNKNVYPMFSKLTTKRIAETKRAEMDEHIHICLYIPIRSMFMQENSIK